MIIDIRYFLLRKIEESHQEIVKRWKSGDEAIEETFDKVGRYFNKLDEVSKRYEEAF